MKFLQYKEEVKDLWKEYDLGINGNPLIKELEIMYKSKWRSSAETKCLNPRS